MFRLFGRSFDRSVSESCFCSFVRSLVRSVSRSFNHSVGQLAVLDISTRPLAQASVKSVGRVQILDHSPVWRVQFSSPRSYLKIKIKNDFTLHFGKKIPKRKLTISTLQSFVFRKASDVPHSTKQYGFPLAIIT